MERARPGLQIATRMGGYLLGSLPDPAGPSRIAPEPIGSADSYGKEYVRKPMLPATLFICRTCNTSKKVETKGEVIQGPSCSVCRKPMRKVTPVQSELDLFPSKRRKM